MMRPVNSARVHWTRYARYPISACGLTVGSYTAQARRRDRILLVDAEDSGLWQGLVLDCIECGEALLLWKMQAALHMRACGMRILAMEQQLEAMRAQLPPPIRHVRASVGDVTSAPVLRRSYDKCPACGSSAASTWGCERCVSADGRRLCICSAPVGRPGDAVCSVCGGTPRC